MPGSCQVVEKRISSKNDDDDDDDVGRLVRLLALKGAAYITLKSRMWLLVV